MSNFRYTRPETFPPVVKNIIIINILVFVAQNLYDQEGKMTELFALQVYGSPYFKPYQMVTHMFMHGDFMHLFINMLIFWMVGRVLEVYIGSKRFLILYFVAGLSSALLDSAIGVIWFDYQTTWDRILMYDPETQADQISALIRYVIPSIGASGAISGVLVVYGLMFPNSEFNAFLIPFPIKAKYFIPGLLVLDLFGAFYPTRGDQVGHWGHIGGAIAGFIMVYYWNKTNRNTLY